MLTGVPLPGEQLGGGGAGIPAQQHQATSPGPGGVAVPSLLRRGQILSTHIYKLHIYTVHIYTCRVWEGAQEPPEKVTQLLEVGVV